MGIICLMKQKNPSGDATEGGSRPAGTSQRGGAAAPVWRQVDGAPVSCLEKIKVLNQNYAELKQVAQDALEDALLMGCNEDQMRRVLHELVDDLVNPYPASQAAPRTPDESP
jgi:hypothetical protein